MSEEVMYQHIDLYVNEYSVDLQAEGKRAVQVLFDSARERGLIPAVSGPLFLDSAHAAAHDVVPDEHSAGGRSRS